MKKVLSKILIVTLILIFITEFVFANPVFAIDGVEVINSISDIMGGVVSIVFWPKRIMITGVAFVANQAAKLLAEMDTPDSEKITETLITPFHIFFNKCKILDVNFFDIDGLDTDSVTYKIRTRVSKWFYVMRLLATAILLVILIYVGIRMALSSVAEEKSKYKKMLFDWMCSLALVYVLQYIAIFVIYANDAIVKALEHVVKTVDVFGNTDISDIVADIGIQAVTGIGIDSMTSVIVYALLIFQIIGYIVAYMSRMIKVGFLLIISPLITITYSIDKMGDGKSQAVNNWLKEFIYTILIQPFHCVIYMTFISVAFKLIKGSAGGGLAGALTATKEYNQLANAVLAVLCIKFIKDAEEMVRKIFGFADNNKDTSLAAGLAMTAVVANKAGNIGKGARGIASKVKNNNMFKAVTKDLGALGGAFKGTKMFGKLAQKASDLKQKFQDSGAGKALKAGKDAVSKAKGNIKKASDKFRKFAGNNKAIKGFNKALGKGKKLWNSKPVKFMRGRNSLSSALGIAAGLAHYASTDSSPFTSIAVGNAAYQSADAFLTSSAATVGAQNADLIEQREQGRAEELKETTDKKEELEKDRNEEIARLEETENNLDEINEDLEEAQNDLQEIDDEPEPINDSGEPDESASAEREERRANAASRVESLTQQRNSLIEQRDKSIERIDSLENDIRVKEQEIERINKDVNSTKAATGSNGMEGYLERIKEDGDRGKFNKSKSKEYAAIERDLKVALNSAEMDASYDILSDRIARQVAADPKGFDMNSILRQCLGDEVMADSKNYEKILSAARNLKNFECESEIYNKTKFANDMNVTTKKIGQKTFDSYKS